MKSYDEIADRVLARRDAYEKEQKRRRKTILTLTPVAAAFAIVTVIALATLLNPIESTSPHNTDPQATDSSGRTLWADNRVYNGASAAATESGYVLPWEYRTDPERYFEITFRNTDYRTRYSFAVGDGQAYGEIQETSVGEKLGSTLAVGFDDYSGLPKSTRCEIYEIKGIDPTDLIAVRFISTDAYYVFLSENAEHAPSTLGELLDRYALAETLPFLRFYDYEGGRNSEPGHYLVRAEQSAAVYEILSRCRDAAAVPDGYSTVAQDERVSFTASSEVLGIANKAFVIGADGYVKTNLAEYGYAYFIGVDAAAEIIALVRTDAVAYGDAAESRYYLTGTITAVGDGYVTVDDSIMMKDPDDGIVFTVYLNDFRVRRYVDCGYLGVGSTVRIEYDGNIYADAPTVIETALAIEKVIVSADGDVWIPE